jgi:hydrogenase maturation protease
MNDDIVVIGIGNELQGDDGFGVHAARYLRCRVPAGVEVIEGSTHAPDLLPFLEERRLALFIDSIEAGEEPGTIFRFTPDELKPSAHRPVTLHDFGLFELLAAAKLLGREPDEVVILAVQVEELGVGMTLSPRVAKSLPRVAELVMGEVERMSGG